MTTATIVGHDADATLTSSGLALRVAGLDKHYGPILGCSDVSFEVASGEALGIIGESGSGKTTVMRCIAGDQDPTRGDLRLASVGDGATNV